MNISDLLWVFISLLYHNSLNFLPFSSLVNFSHSTPFEHFWVGDALRNVTLDTCPLKGILWHAAAPIYTIRTPSVWAPERLPSLGILMSLPYWHTPIQWGIIQNPAFFWWLICQNNTTSGELVRRSDAHCKCGYLDLSKNFYLTDLVPWYGQHSCEI